MKNEHAALVQDLALAWKLAKGREAEANKARLDIEADLVSALGVKEEGSETHELPDGTKVTITGKINYKCDLPHLLDLAGQLPERYRPLQTVTKLDETGAKFLRANEPELWRVIEPAFTLAPAKTSISIK